MKIYQTKAFYFSILILVAIIWGLDPIVNRYLYQYYSASALSALSTLLSAMFFFLLSVRKLHLLNRSYLRIALPIGLINSLACLLQRIGLQYTTPARYSFLEHLSCVVVPVLMFLFFKKRPTPLQWIAGALCICGCLLLTGAGAEGGILGPGEILCALAGILFGVCIVATGIYAKELDINLFMMIHMSIYFITSVGMAVGLHTVKTDGHPIEPFTFSFNIRHLLIGILFGFLSVGICWLLRTEATRHVSPPIVASVMPFSAVVSGTVSVLAGFDQISSSFLLASAMIITAAILSGLSDTQKKKRPL